MSKDVISLIILICIFVFIVVGLIIMRLKEYIDYKYDEGFKDGVYSCKRAYNDIENRFSKQIDFMQEENEKLLRDMSKYSSRKYLRNRTTKTPDQRKRMVMKARALAEKLYGGDIPDVDYILALNFIHTHNVRKREGLGE